jgi:hypothetical protein
MLHHLFLMCPCWSSGDRTSNLGCEVSDPDLAGLLLILVPSLGWFSNTTQVTFLCNVVKYFCTSCANALQPISTSASPSRGANHDIKLCMSRCFDGESRKSYLEDSEPMISVGMHMGLATVDSRRDSDVSSKKAPSADSLVFLLSVSTGSLNFCKGHCDTTPLEPGHLYFPQLHLHPVVRSPACLTDVPY